MCGHGALCEDNVGFDAYLRAKRNMDYGYDLVGIMENFTETAQLIYALHPQFFNTGQISYPNMKKNTTPKRVKREPVTDRHRRILEKNQKWDMLLYRKALRQFNAIKHQYLYQYPD